MPDKLERAIVRGRGVLPLVAAELARVHPDLWKTAKEVDHWRLRKGTRFPIEYTDWKLGTLSALTVVAYRRPGQTRGSPHRAIIPGDVFCTDAAKLDLEVAGFGEVTAVQIVGTRRRPGNHPPREAAPPKEKPQPAPHADCWCAEPQPGDEPTETVHDHPKRWTVLTPPFDSWFSDPDQPAGTEVA
jgi:hypothetical protein